MSMETKEHFATNVYYDRTFDCDAAKILPGEYYYTGQDMVIVTVLGSCVSACIRDRVTGLGGMNHFMLPDGGDSNSPVSASMRYGTYAMEVLINELLKSGARRENLEAIAFIKELNEVAHRECPGTLMIAEESTAWPAVSHPVYAGGNLTIESQKPSMLLTTFMNPSKLAGLVM